MGVTKDEFFKAFDRNNQFIKAEKRRKAIHEVKKKNYEINDFKIEVVGKARKSRSKCSRGKIE